MNGRRSRILTTTVAVVLLAGPAATAASARVGSPGTGGDDFYATEQPRPEGRPGQVIRSEPIAAPEGAQAWRVLYHSRDVGGNDIAVSGIVVAPDGDPPPGGRPVVAWAHATTGIGDACAPSRGPSPASSIPWVDELIDAGYVVAATDYEGLGTEGVHPYLVGVSEGRGVLDSIRAARGLPTGANRRAAVYGHSQGGHSALFAGELAKGYAPDIALKGVAAGAPVAAPEEFVDHTIEVNGIIGFLVMGALGYQAAYPELAAMPLLTSASAEQAATPVDGCAFEIMEAFAGEDPDVVFGVDPRRVEAWEDRLRENAAGRRRSAAPVLYWQGDADDLTHPESADAYVARACRKGTVVDYRVYPGANHATVVGAAHDTVLGFFDHVLSGGRVTSSCRD